MTASRTRVTGESGTAKPSHLRAGDIDYGSFEFDEPSEAEIERRQRLTDS
jgi:hypothetical protein